MPKTNRIRLSELCPECFSPLEEITEEWQAFPEDGPQFRVYDKCTKPGCNYMHMKKDELHLVQLNN